MGQSHSGQTISEYMLAAALIAIVSIGALTFMANDLASSLPGLLDSIFGGGTGVSASGGNGGSGPGTGDPGSGDPTGGDPGTGDPGTGDATEDVVVSDLPGPPGIGQEQVCFSSGLCVNLPEGDTETAGGLGEEDTRILTDIINQIADQLEQDGADPSLISMIRDLANYGHLMGNEEGSIAGGGQSGVQDTIDHLKGTMVPKFNGDLSAVLDALSAAGYADAQSIIDWAGGNIVTIANGIDVYMAGGESDGSEGMVTHNSAEEETRINANTICSTGGAAGCTKTASSTGDG